MAEHVHSTSTRLAALAQMMDAAARAKTLVLPEADAFDAAAHPDAELLTLCAEITSCTALADRLREGDLAVRDFTNKSAIVERSDRLMRAMRERAKAIEKALPIRATTLDGVREKAAAFRCLYTQTSGRKNESFLSIVDDLLTVARREPKATQVAEGRA